MTAARGCRTKMQEKISWIIGQERLGSNDGIDPSSDRAPQTRPGAWLREAGGANRTDAGNRHDLVAGASLGIGMLHRLNALSQSHQRCGDRDGRWATPQGSCGKGSDLRSLLSIWGLRCGGPRVGCSRLARAAARARFLRACPDKRKRWPLAAPIKGWRTRKP
jgi:hypothetical protein